MYNNIKKHHCVTNLLSLSFCLNTKRQSSCSTYRMKAFLFYNTKVRSNGILKKKEIPWLYMKKSKAAFLGIGL
ncbi:hypothetical protein CYK58_03305 [Helicobacter pylori]|nr:hypothetical protein CYK58_03305 [Helicobacter pylori]